MGIIILVIIIAILMSNSNTGQAQNRNRNSQNVNRGNGYGASHSTINQEEEWMKTAREHLEKAKKVAVDTWREVERDILAEEETESSFGQPEYVKPAYVKPETINEQGYINRMQPQKTTILERAKANVEEEKADEVLLQMEKEHKHSERVAPAVHYHPEDEITENTLGTIEDLMVKGYDGNLCFERDFVGEGMDMISQFTLV